MKARIKEHHWHIQLYNPDKSAMAEHSINLGHHIQFIDTIILAKRFECMEHIIRKATKIELHLTT